MTDQTITPLRKLFRDLTGGPHWKAGPHAGEPGVVTFKLPPCRRHTGEADLGRYAYPCGQTPCARCVLSRKLAAGSINGFEYRAEITRIRNYIAHPLMLPAPQPIQRRALLRPTQAIAARLRAEAEPLGGAVMASLRERAAAAAKFFQRDQIKGASLNSLCLVNRCKK